MAGGDMANRDLNPSDQYQMRTRMIHGNRENIKWDFDHHLVPPMSASAAYRLHTVGRDAQGFAAFAADDSGGAMPTPIYIYDRLDEPTRGMLEDHVADAEVGDMAVCFASGMAAISAAIGVTTQSGDEIVAHHTLYGCTYNLFTTWLPRWGVKVNFADLRDRESFAQALTDRTRVIYYETPVNPTLTLIDIEQVKRWTEAINAERRPEARLVTIVDNTFATPYCQRPLQHGADLVVQSLTNSSRFVLIFLYDLCRKALSKPISCPRSRLECHLHSENRSEAWSLQLWVSIGVELRPR